MITVLYILDYGTVGGATKAFITLVHQLLKHCINPIVVTGKFNDLNAQLESMGIKTVAAGHCTAIEPLSFKSVKWPFRLFKLLIRYYYKEYVAYKKLEKEIDFAKIDIIHTNSARNTLGCRFAKKHKIPHIMHIREFGDKDFNCVKLNPRYIKLLNLYTDQFVSVSKAVKQYWDSQGINENKNVVIYDGVDFSDITESNDEDKMNSILKMVVNGGVYETKGQHLIIEAIKMLPYSIQQNLQLDIAGWGNKKYITEILNNAREAGLGSSVKYLGSIDNVHQRIGSYQIGFMCSRSEGFGLVTAEYMHGRLGVIASKSGASPELIEDEVSGLLFKCGDAKSLSDCIKRLYNDRQLLKNLSIEAQKKARTFFTQTKNANSVYELYKEILKKYQ